MSLKLSEDEIRRRLQDGRNYKRLYRDLKIKYDVVVAENRELRQLLAAATAQLETQNIRIAELETMVFGKRRKPPTGTAVPVSPLSAPASPRDAASYRRPVPAPDSITDTVQCPVAACARCGGKLGDSTEHVRYVEDVALPGLTPGYIPHLVTKYVIAKGICTACGRTTAGRELGGAEVSLGPNVRLLAADLISRMGLSYSQVSGLLLGLYGLAVSGGELSNLLGRQHRDWLPAYGRLKAVIRAAPVKHYDETPWKIQALQGGYAWVAADAGSEAVCFALEQSRGARHARALHGEPSENSVFVTDGYAAYRNLPGRQQLCWAHLHRGIRDLACNDSLPERQRPYCQDWYASFAGIYHDLRQHLAELYDTQRRTQQADLLWQRVAALADQPAPPEGEPEKLRRLKAQLRQAGRDRLLVCLTADAPCDNNRAERDLRQLVCKRKRSFGSKTQKGANALATVLSLCTTTWRRAQRDSNPAGYFTRLAALAG